MFSPKIMNVSYDHLDSKLLRLLTILSVVTLLVGILSVVNRCLEVEDFCLRLMKILSLVIRLVVILSVVNHCLRLMLMAEDYHGLLMVQRQLRQERARTK